MPVGQSCESFSAIHTTSMIILNITVYSLKRPLTLGTARLTMHLFFKFDQTFFNSAKTCEVNLDTLPLWRITGEPNIGKKCPVDEKRPLQLS
ncbi:hypothetical protein RRG08_050778 [Elysia crispata]|uniref:Uncharacterized protein n=1 Tax=Elysia crispata TaxID=231223 RepID=A0AAE0YH52_9GAST|nr:hypothetical protein RRG08_050778 [Elysia crispata]